MRTPIPSLSILGLVAAQKASTASTITGLVILLAVLCGVAWGIRALVRRRRGWNALTPDEQEHRKATRAADKSVKRAMRDYKRAVSNARSELERAIKQQELGSLNGVVLYDENIKTDSGLHPLTPNVTAAVDSAGALGSRSTLTRMGAGALVTGPFFWPFGLLAGAAAKKTVDKRELYLLIEGGEWADLTKCNPDHGDKARSFAQSVNVAARNVERVKTDRKRRVEELTERLAAVEANRSAIEAAEHVRAQLGDDWKMDAEPDPGPTG
jgi:hypothetical protein